MKWTASLIDTLRVRAPISRHEAERLWCVLLVGWTAVAAASEDIVRIAPVVRQSPTAQGDERYPGIGPPPSDSPIDSESTFYVEIWATNIDAPLDGLACVYVDLFYDRTDLMDVVPPTEDSPLFPVDAVSPVLDDETGTIDDIGGCQSIPTINFLGVDEWVLVERMEMSAVGVGGPVTLTLTDANNLFAGTSIIGQLVNVDVAHIVFDSRTFRIGGCTSDAECDDGTPCTGTETCEPDGTCLHVLAEDCNENDIEDWCDIDSETSPDCNENGVPDECEDLRPADFDSDGDVDLIDFGWFQLCVGQTPGVPDGRDRCLCTFDFNGDGTVDLDDYAGFQDAL